MNANPRTIDRGRGRPSDTESGVLQEQILDAAEHLFSDRGFSATPVREVASQAGVNPALVHYYFGNKSGLLEAVMDRALLPIAARIAAMKEAGPISAQQFTALFFEMSARHPAMPRLVVREVMLSGGDTRELFVEKYAPRLGGALPGILASEQQRGNVDPEFDPANAALMLMSLCMFPLIARPVAEAGLGVDYSDEGRQRYLAQINRLLEKGISP